MAAASGTIKRRMIKVCFSGKVQWFPNVFPIEERLPMRLLRFLPLLNNPWNLSTARRWAAPGPRFLR
jgi:hypothetical protein